jgi:hypothetical protein
VRVFFVLFVAALTAPITVVFHNLTENSNFHFSRYKHMQDEKRQDVFCLQYQDKLLQLHSDYSLVIDEVSYSLTVNAITPQEYHCTLYIIERRLAPVAQPCAAFYITYDFCKKNAQFRFVLQDLFASYYEMSSSLVDFIALCEQCKQKIACTTLGAPKEAILPSLPKKTEENNANWLQKFWTFCLNVLKKYMFCFSNR